MDIVDPAVSEYLLEHCTPADGLLRELAAETREAFGRAAGMQVSHDEGELLTMLTRAPRPRGRTCGRPWKPSTASEPGSSPTARRRS